MPKFKTLIIDPPWPYDPASKHEKLSGYVTQTGNNQYKTLTIEDLRELPISEVMHETEAYLFLWATSPFLPDAFSLVEAWGFQYVTTLCWYKNTGLGVGFWVRGSHELVLVGKRHGASSIRTGEQSVLKDIEGGAFESKRLRHSAKPPFLHEFIEERRKPYENERKCKGDAGDIIITNHETPASFPGPFLEIFARGEARPGWTVLGNEAAGDEKDIRDSLPALIERINEESLPQ